jgi:hypothetical protein
VYLSNEGILMISPLPAKYLLSSTEATSFLKAKLLRGAPRHLDCGPRVLETCSEGALRRQSARG